MVQSPIEAPPRHPVTGRIMEADNMRIRARIIAPGTTRPVMTWTSEDGWREWDERGGAA